MLIYETMMKGKQLMWDDLKVMAGGLVVADCECGLSIGSSQAGAPK